MTTDNHSKPTPNESAQLILKLFELRREDKMRQARDWMWTWKPKTFEDVKTTLHGPDSAKMRMVLGYWDMAAALVNHGAIDVTMFNDTNGEFLSAFCKVEPFLTEFRTIMSPTYLAQLEKLVRARPGSAEAMARYRAM